MALNLEAMGRPVAKGNEEWPRGSDCPHSAFLRRYKKQTAQAFEWVDLPHIIADSVRLTDFVPTSERGGLTSCQ